MNSKFIIRFVERKEKCRNVILRLKFKFILCKIFSAHCVCVRTLGKFHAYLFSGRPARGIVCDFIIVEALCMNEKEIHRLHVA